MSPQPASRGFEAHEIPAAKANAHVIVWLMSCALLRTAMGSSPPDQELVPMDKSERKDKTLAEKLKEKLVSMVQVRRGLSVDSGAADHVLPLTWLAWLVITASVGSLKGPHYSATGVRIPNMGRKLDKSMTSDGA